jgi:hypothetical protein
MNILPEAGSWLGSASRGHSKANFDRQPWGESLKGKFLGAVTHPETGVTEFSYLLDQRGQAWCHL